MSGPQIIPDPERIGLGKTEVFQTLASLVPTVMYQEKKSVAEAADKALVIVLACIIRTELAFMPEAERARLMDRSTAPTVRDATQQPGLGREQGRRMTDDEAHLAAAQQVMRQTERR